MVTVKAAARTEGKQSGNGQLSAPYQVGKFKLAWIRYDFMLLLTIEVILVP